MIQTSEHRFYLCSLSSSSLARSLRGRGKGEGEELKEFRAAIQSQGTTKLQRAITLRRRYAADDAKLVAKLLVKADLRGYPGHGVTRVAPYLAWIKDGTINLREGPKIVREGKITAVIEGNHYIGQVAAHMAMELAIKKAKEHGVGVVTLRRASHSGRLADYMEMAADEG